MSLTVEQVAARYHVEPSTVREWARTGELPAFKRGKFWRFTESELNRRDEIREKIEAILSWPHDPNWIFKNQTQKHAPHRENITYQSLRGRRLKKATPRWANRKAIAVIYSQARYLTRTTGNPHHVDHIVPLQGKSVRGLHVENNLRVIPSTDNHRKSNKFLCL